ncbi:MAG TPA: FAD-dependent monooxygenase [Phycisphaerales bacterium]|nr:FAD-dependent monooxygenase [Phycisphaerales bacterium]
MGRSNADIHVLIAGAGLAGALMACYLAREGYRVSLFERRSDPRAHGYAGGRSINLALSARGIAGLAGAGLDERVMRSDAIRMPGRMIHPPGPPNSTTPTYFLPYSHDPKDAINSVSRGGLNLTLIKAAAEHRSVSLTFDHFCIDVDLDSPAPAAIFQKPDGSITRVEADLIIGADGAFSGVRGRLQKTDRFEYSQSYLEHGYKELHIPPAPNSAPRTSAPSANSAVESSSFAMEPHALHIWPRGQSMMIALPNRDGSFTCTLFWPFKGPHSFENLRTPPDIERHFREHYPDAVPLMPTLVEDYTRNPTSSLVTVRCWPWQHGGRVALLGDAAHAIVPFYGQGMNAAFEDCTALSRCLREHPPERSGNRWDFTGALSAYQADRKPNADAIADMAVENFVEMRDKTGQPDFVYRKKVEQAVHHAHLGTVTPQYNLVSFSTVPYAQARQRGRELDRVLDAVIREVPRGSIETLGDANWRSRVAEVAGRVLAGGGSSSGDKRLIDITPAITPTTNVWPGDTCPSREVLCDISRGDNITLSTLRTTVHLGAHADGPNHYGDKAPSVGEMPLDHYIGPCHVIAATTPSAQRVLPQHCTGLDAIRHPRVLIRTGTFPSFESWNSDFAALSVELVEALAAKGVRTIGIDTPSVDLQDSKDLPAHKAILKQGIAILEGLDLQSVAPGEYELIAAPLKLMGFDGSPVRAVLRPLA